MIDSKIETQNFVSFINSFKGETFDELAISFNFHTKSKSKNALLIKRIAEGYKGKEFFKTLIETNNLSTKTIQLLKNNKVKEAMSFPKFCYESIIDESWKTSAAKQIFSKTFIFCVFKFSDDKNIFMGAFLWKMPKEDLNGEVRDMWEKTKNIIISGNIVKNAGNKIRLNFPKENETNICHVRPHGRNSLDLARLPERDTLTGFFGLPKHSFWLNHNYLNKVIQEHANMLLADFVCYNK